MKQIPASVFKSRCLKIMDEIQATREPAVITKRGIPVVKVIPEGSQPVDLFGFMAGEFEIVGDVESPVFPSKNWVVLRK